MKTRQFAVLLFAFSMLLSTAVSNLALGLIVLSAALSPNDLWSTVKKQPAFFLAVAFVVFVLLRQALGYSTLGSDISEAKPWVYLSLFWLFGWAIGEKKVIWQWFLGLSFLGFLTRIVVGFDLNRVMAAIHESKSFGFDETAASIGFALYTTTVLIGWVVWRKKLINIIPNKLVAVLVWTVLAIVVFEVLVMTNSRGSWLAALAALFALGICNWFVYKRFASLKRAILACFAITSMIFILNGNTLGQRIASENNTYDAIVSAKSIDEIPYTSAGLRIHMYAYALDLIKERPWLGWGAGSTRFLLSQSQDEQIQVFPHFHSGYLQVLVQFGVVGGVFFIVMFTLLMQPLWKLLMEPGSEKNWAIFLVSGIVAMLVWNLFDVRLEHADYRFYTLHMLGLWFAVIASHKKQSSL
jgi:O-antigen ligase